MFDFLRDLADAVVGFFTGDGDDEPAEPDPCDVGDCLEAKEEHAAAQRGVRSACNWVGFIRATLIIPEWIINRTLADAFAVMVVAFIIGGLGGVVTAIVIMAGAYMLSWVFIRAMLPAVRAAANTLVQAMTAEHEAIARVTQECPEACRGDLEPTGCRYIDEQRGVVGEILGS